MNPNLLRARFTRLFVVLASGGAFFASARAQSSAEPVAQIAALKLDHYVVSASRTPQDPRYTPASVSIVPLEDLRDAQIATLSDALAEQPGVILYRSGALGSQSTILLRGANAHQTLFLVDGVRMNDRTSTFQNFLGGADLVGLDRIEVLRGPQSTLYGSSAMGGVILMETEHGAGPFAGTVSGLAGSFETFGGALTVKGAENGFSYSGALSRYETDNERPQNEFEAWSYSARAEYDVAPALTIGATFRGQDSDYNEPGSRLFPFPGSVEFSNYLTTVYGEARVGEKFASRLTLASHVRDYVFRDAFSASPLRNVRKILDWQNTWDPDERVQIVAGANFEDSRFTVSGVPTSDRVAAGYVSAIVRPIEAVTLTGGARHDDFRSAGAATTGRAGVAWVSAAGTKVRATYGTGFAAPGSDDVYGVPSYNQLPSPGLLPEKSQGWDAGIDQDFLAGAATVSATYFHNRFRNLFEYETVDFTTFAGRTVNRARASSEGVELAVVARFLDGRVKTRGSYTYLEAENDITGARLIRRPRHTGDAEVTVQATPALRVGAGAHFVSGRLESTGPFEDYTAMRVFASYALRRGLLAKVRAENALDERYEEVLGYPALSRAIYGSVEWRF